MAVRDDVSIDWAVSPRIIEVDMPSTSIKVQDLVDTLRSHEEEPDNLDKDYLIDASGKEDLGDDLKVGITLVLNNAKLKFADRALTWITCNVYGGNLLAKDSQGDLMNPIESSSYVTVSLTQSVSASLMQNENIDAIKAKTDNIPDNPVAVSDLSVIQNKTDNIPNDPVAVSDLGVIQDKTDNIPDNPVDTSDLLGIPNSVDAKLTAEHGGGVWTQIQVNLDDIESLLNTINSNLNAVKTKTDTIDWVKVELLWDEAGGKREIINNQEIFYKADNQTEVMRFNLYDANGNPAMENVYRRERV
jgi:hypothetical protein